MLVGWVLPYELAHPMGICVEFACNVVFSSSPIFLLSSPQKAIYKHHQHNLRDINIIGAVVNIISMINIPSTNVFVAIALILTLIWVLRSTVVCPSIKLDLLIASFTMNHAAFRLRV